MSKLRIEKRVTKKNNSLPNLANTIAVQTQYRQDELHFKEIFTKQNVDKALHAHYENRRFQIGNRHLLGNGDQIDNVDDLSDNELDCQDDNEGGIESDVHVIPASAITSLVHLEILDDTLIDDDNDDKDKTDVPSNVANSGSTLLADNWKRLESIASLQTDDKCKHLIAVHIIICELLTATPKTPIVMHPNMTGIVDSTHAPLTNISLKQSIFEPYMTLFEMAPLINIETRRKCVDSMLFMFGAKSNTNVKYKINLESIKANPNLCLGYVLLLSTIYALSVCQNNQLGIIKSSCSQIIMFLTDIRYQSRAHSIIRQRCFIRAIE